MKLDPKLFLKTPNYTINQLTPDMVSQSYLDWFNDELVSRFILNKPKSITELVQYADSFYQREDSLLMGIFSTGIHVANIKLEPIDFKNGHAIFGVIIGNSNFRGVGLLQEVIPVISEYFKGEMSINKIFLGVENENIGAIKSYEKCGFKVVLPHLSPIKSTPGIKSMLLNS
jgi:RimJ/RimL family protein N-acetyltransferase